MSLSVTQLKSNAKYTCQECGSTELIQAHHEVLGDDDSLVILCAGHHSKRHPNVPKQLFFAKKNQHYWHNTSAASLARTWKISSRTVMRAARRLGIHSGELSPADEKLIKVNIPKLAESTTSTPATKETVIEVTTPSAKADGFLGHACATAPRYVPNAQSERTNGTSVVTTVPREVVERAAEQAGMSTEKFIESHECEWLYNSFDGVLLRFMPKRNPNPPVTEE